MEPNVPLLKQLIDDNTRDLKLISRYASEVTRRQAHLELIHERQLLKKQYFLLTGIEELAEAPVPVAAKPERGSDDSPKEPVHV